jgi:DNA-binding HxlR family transcriptional regulator
VQAARVRTVGRRTYDQFCGLAKTLDVLGERWSLLIVRDLLIGPKRFSDLLDSVAGIGANALSARLKEFEVNGIVRKRKLPPPAGSTVYELTPRGRALEPALMALMRWGLPLLAEAEGHSFRPSWLILGIQGTFNPEVARDVTRTYLLRVEEEVFTIRMDRGEIDVSQGEGDHDVAVSLDPDTLLEVGSGKLSARDAIDSGRATVEKGDPEEVVAFASFLRLPTEAEVTAPAPA